MQAIGRYATADGRPFGSRFEVVLNHSQCLDDFGLSLDIHVPRRRGRDAVGEHCRECVRSAEVFCRRGEHTIATEKREIGLRALGVDELSIGDTIGVATPNQVGDVVGALREVTSLDRLAMHFHDTRGTALANVLTALELGVTIFDSSSGGLGGCPYAPGASGNLATEDLLYLLHGMGIETGINLDAVVAASRYLAGVRGMAPASRYYAAATATS